jgi:hypothetical protein
VATSLLKKCCHAWSLFFRDLQHYRLRHNLLDVCERCQSLKACVISLFASQKFPFLEIKQNSQITEHGR